MGVYLTDAQEDIIFDFLVAAIDDTDVEVVSGFEAEDAPAEPYVSFFTSIPPVREGNPQHRHLSGQQFEFAMRYMLPVSIMVYDAPGGVPITRKIQNALKLPPKLKILQDGGFANRGILFIDDVSAIFKSRYQRVSLIDLGLSFAEDVQTSLDTIEKIEISADFGETQASFEVDNKHIFSLVFSDSENSLYIPLI